MNWTPLPVPACRLGESPMWHPVTGHLYWCDIPAGTLHRSDGDGADHRQWSLGTDVACCAPVVDGSLVLALRTGLVRFDPTDASVRALLAAPYDTATERFNDGKVDPAGRLWIGTIYEPRKPPLASVYCVQPGVGGGLDITRRATDVTVSNGMAFSPDGRTIWRSDTTSHTIFRADYSIETGETGAWIPWARRAMRDPAQPPEAYGGRPDGAAVDAQGCYWSAMYEGQCLIRYAPDGTELQRIELPVRCPTMPCFGGPELRTLYVTTACDKRPAEELAAQPWAGLVLRATVDVPGLPLHCMKLV